MRLPRASAWSVGLMLPLLASGSAFARAPFSSPAKPSAFQQAFDVLYEDLPDYLDEAKCGGFSKSESAEGMIATVTGMPGYEGVWDAAIWSGMGVRISGSGAYVFPGNTTGYSTVFAPDGGVTIEKTVWDDAKKAKVAKNFQRPFFSDPPCLWRSTGTISSRPIGEGAQVLAYAELEPPHSPERCAEFKDWLNRFRYQDCRVVGPDEVCKLWCERYTGTDNWTSVCTGELPPLCEVDQPAPPPPPNNNNNNQVIQNNNQQGQQLQQNNQQQQGGNQQGPQQLINNNPLGGQLLGPGVLGLINNGNGEPPEQCVYPKDPEPDPNARDCTGKQCQCPNPDAPCTLVSRQPNGTIFLKETKDPKPVVQGMKILLTIEGNGPEGEARDYKSYFRKYQGGYTRKSTPFVPKDISSNSAILGCYGFYDQYDPFKRETVTKDHRCTMNIDVSEYRDTQLGRGDYGSVLPDINPLLNENQRDNGAYDEDDDTWFRRLGRAFSLLNPKRFEERYGKSLSTLLLDGTSLDTASLKAPAQIRDDAPLANDGLRMRDFDDTAQQRNFSRWWKEQEDEANSLFGEQIVRLILPLGLVRNIVKTDPLFGEIPEVERSLRDPRSQSVELQLFAREDILGEVFAYLERALMPLEEEPMNVIVPMASPVDLRARAADFCLAYMAEPTENDRGAKSCDGAPQKLRDVIDWLNKTADDIDTVRLLRGELYRYTGYLLDIQGKMARPLNDWLNDNRGKYDALVAQRKEIERQLYPMWLQATASMRSFNEGTNLPWCMNQRFTTPMYSFMYKWLQDTAAGINGGAPAGSSSGGSSSLSSGGAGVPTIDRFLRPKDIVVDLSRIRFMTGSIKIPVIKPVQVRLDLPRALNLQGTLPDVPPRLPDMAALANSMLEGLNNLPPVDVKAEAPASEIPAPIPQETFDSIKDSLAGVNASIAALDYRYRMFWASIGPLHPQPWTADEFIFAGEKQRLECDGWDDEHCQIVEPEGIAALRRIGSRGMVQLKQDYESNAQPRGAEQVCLPYDDACRLLHSLVRAKTYEWNIFMQKPDGQQGALDRIRAKLRNLSLPEPVGTLNPAPRYDVTGTGVLLPSLDNPPLIDLKP